MSKWAFTQIEPQPARGTLREEMWDSPDWIAEEKYDGDRRIAQFCGKVVRFTGRRKSVKDGLFVEKTENVPHLSAAYSVVGKGIEGYPAKHKVTVPPAALEGTVLDGEMIAGGQYHAIEGGRAGGMSKYVTSIMGSRPEEAVRKQIERGWLRYVVFDCLFYKGKDVRGSFHNTRWILAKRAIEEWKNPFVTLSENGLGNKRRFYDEIVKRGGEGVILKHVEGVYGDRQAWVKVKKQATADVVIMGFVPAKLLSTKKGDDHATMTKYAAKGLIGAVQVGQYVEGLVDEATGSMQRNKSLIEVATVSGIDDLLREEMTKYPKKFIGKVVEIEHNGREPTGRFRHPRFNRSRPDKQAKDCIYREDES